MDMITSPLFWLILALSVGIATLFIAGARTLAYRLGGRPETLPSTLRSTLVAPTIRAPALWRTLRTLLLIAVLATGTDLILTRFIFGLGAVTNLSDQFPLGFWIGFDVMSGVALAAGAFVIAATVHIFRIERFEPLVRPAILTGLLGYLLVIVGLLVDLGRPYNVWRPLVHWQHHSVLWEVGVCVATYTTVLFIEFLPVILERVNKVDAITKHLPTVPLYRWLKRASIVFVILGVVLSTLHQSSLGSMWVLIPTKLSPLWYSILLPVFFWMSAVAVGFAMVIVESTLSAKAFKRGLELDLLAELGKIASVILFIYLLARGADLIWRGAWPLAFEPTVQAASFWAEILLGVLVPAILLSIASLRRRPKVLFWSAMLMVVFGVVLNRLNVNMVGVWPYTGYIYFPAWSEVLISITIVTLGVLAFAAAVRYLPVFPETNEHGT